MYKQQILSFVGAPGAGKGVVLEKCVRELGFKGLSTGNLCRKHILLGTELGRVIAEYVGSGKLIPDELINSMVISWLEVNQDEKSSIILDGYPRTIAQVEFFNENIEKFLPNYDFKVICFIISQECALKRLINRLTCDNKDCQIVYSSVKANERRICKYCGGQLVKRNDDEFEKALKRIQKYPKYKEAILSKHKFLGTRIEEIQVDDREVEEVFCDFKKILNG